VVEAGPVKDGDSVVTLAIKVEGVEHESGASMTVVVLAWVRCYRRNCGKPAGEARRMKHIIGKAGSVWRRQETHVLDGHSEGRVWLSITSSDGQAQFESFLVKRKFLCSLKKPPPRPPPNCGYSL